MSLSSVTSFVTSRQKWHKVGLIARELSQCLLSSLSAGRRVPAPQSLETASESATRTEWHYDVSIPMSKELFGMSYVKESQDTFTPSDNDAQHGLLKTRLEYELHELPHAAMYTNDTTHRSVYNGANHRIDTLSSVRRHLPGTRTLPMPPARAIAGLSANLYGTTGMSNGNYGHWLMDGLSRLILIERDYPLSAIDNIVVPPLKFDFHRDSLRALGVDDRQLIELSALDCLRFDRLICTSAPRDRSSSVCPGWLIDEYRRRLLPQYPAQRSDRRLYISRRDAGGRKFDNEEELITALEAEGFEAVELSGHDFAGKIRLFSEAECVVGLSGAGLTSVMFCPPHARVLELFPSTHVSYIYATICAYLGLAYEHLQFENTSAVGNLNSYYGNFHLEPTVLMSKVNQLMASASHRTTDS